MGSLVNLISAVTIARAIATAEKTNCVVATALALFALLALIIMAMITSRAIKTPTDISPAGVSLKTFSSQSLTVGVAKKDIKKPPSVMMA